MWKISANPAAVRKNNHEFSFFVCLCIVEGCIINRRINKVLKTLWGKVENTLKVLEVQKAVRFIGIFFRNGLKFSILFVLSKAHGGEKYPHLSRKIAGWRKRRKDKHG